MRPLIPLLLLLLIAPTAFALDTATRSVGPVHTWVESDLARFDPFWLHVKFVEGSEVALRDGRFAAGLQDLGAVHDALGNVLTIRPTFRGERTTMRQWKARGELASGRVGPDLSLWFDVEVPGGRAHLAAVLNALNALPEVEIAHPAPICETAALHGAAFDQVPVGLAPAARGTTPDFSAQQGYLYATPTGLDAPSAWARPGGRGASVKFIDVELGWTHEHEDFLAGNQFYEGGVNDPSYVAHGTAVLGEVIGANNGLGVVGFAGDASWGTVAITVGEWPTVPHYFQEAIDQLEPGDVWLIELQMYPPGRDATPMEWLQVNYDVIWTSCWALDIVCVEAGANGSQNLDAAFWGGIFDRDVRDSGAILVGAGTPTGRVAEWFTNYGSRIDVHAWGSQIVTTGYGDLYNGGSQSSWYTSAFGGTSGASPMITGSALCLQGIAKATLGAPLTPIELRSLLTSTGIPHLDPAKQIGPRPDLAAAADGLVDPAGVEAAPQNGGSGLLVQTPFTGAAEIRLRRPLAENGRLEINDVHGRLVRALPVSPAEAAAGLIWDGRDLRGAEVGSGVYWLRLTAGGTILTGRTVKVD